MTNTSPTARSSQGSTKPRKTIASTKTTGNTQPATRASDVRKIVREELAKQGLLQDVEISGSTKVKYLDVATSGKVPLDTNRADPRTLDIKP